MPRNTTQKKPRAELTTPQTVVLTALLAGSTITDAAKQAVVDRTSIHRWLKKDWKFQAALNRGQRELKDAVNARLLHMAHQAADTVARAIEEGDTRAALEVLKGLGLLEKGTIQIGNDDPHILQEEAELAASKEAFDRQIHLMSPF